MGAEKSKMNAQNIEDNLRKLITRLELNIIPINKYVVIQLRRAVHLYENMTNGSIKEKILQKKKETINIFIKEALHQLENVSTFENNSTGNIPHDVNWHKQLEKTKCCLKEVEEKLRNNRIKVDEFEDYLEMITCPCQQLDVSSLSVEDVKLTEAKDHMSILFLELFIRTPTASVRDYRRSISYLDDEEKNQKQPSICNVAGDFIDNIKCKPPISSLPPRPLLLTAENDVNKTLKPKSPVPPPRTSKFKLPIPTTRRINANNLENPITTKKEIEKCKLDHQDNIIENEKLLLQYEKDSCSSVWPTNNQVDEKKYFETASFEESDDKITDQITTTMEKEKILQTFKEKDRKEEYIRALQKIYKQIDGFKDLNMVQRKTKLNECKSLVASIKIPDEDIRARQEEIFQKIQTLLDIDYLASHLKVTLFTKQTFLQNEPVLNCQESETVFEKIKASLDKYKVEVQEFTYPFSSNSYRLKRDEISSLLEDLKAISETTNTKEKKNTISCEIHNILKIFDAKATQNEERERSLKLLENIEEEIVAITKSDVESEEKYHALMDCKNKINRIEELSDEIIFEKKKLLREIEELGEKEIEEIMKYCSISVTALKNMKK